MSERDDGPGGPRDGGKEDVLASIRRIVDEEGGGTARRDGVLALTPRMRIEAGRGAPPPASGDEEPPLALTSAMRVEAGATDAAEGEDRDEDEDEDRDAAGPPRPAPDVAPLRPVPPAPTRAAPASVEEAARVSPVPPRREAPAGEVAGMSREALRDLVRETIREELSGEMGTRVSANIKLLVAREVRKAIEALEAEAERDGPAGRDRPPR